MTTMTDEPELTERQRDVLRLTQEGKGPTEIAKAIGITSQGVHGHLRKLREMGLLPQRQARKPIAPRPNGSHVSAEAALAAVRATVDQQAAAIDARQAEIDAQIEVLRNEKRELDKARKALEQYRGPA